MAIFSTTAVVDALESMPGVTLDKPLMEAVLGMVLPVTIDQITPLLVKCGVYSVEGMQPCVIAESRPAESVSRNNVIVYKLTY